MKATVAGPAAQRQIVRPMEDDARPGLVAAAKAHWRSFLPAWIFPVFFLYGGLASESAGHPALFFWVVAAPLFFWSFFRATRVSIRLKIGYWCCVFWAMVVPFLVWTIAVFSRLVVLKVVER